MIIKYFISGKTIQPLIRFVGIVKINETGKADCAYRRSL
jgi:hypothetical protein